MNLHQRGTVLIIIAGVSSLLLALSVAFLSRMRGDADENLQVIREAQARMMLSASCNYVQEASRLGWDDPATPQHEEAFGWIDVRDGGVGPKVEDWTRPGQPKTSRYFSTVLTEDGDGNGSPDRPSWPAIGGVARCPMYLMRRPPSAVALKAAYNPITTDEAATDFGMPYLRNPDPQPAVGNGWPAAVTAASWNDFKRGDRTPVAQSLNLSWFRVLRVAPARFIVTCGAGASGGFKDWPEVVGLGCTGMFIDRSQFDDLVKNECRLWYLIEWSAAVVANDYHNLDNEVTPDHYQWRSFNTSHESRCQSHGRNMVGTIRWIQRLDDPPAQW